MSDRIGGLAQGVEEVACPFCEDGGYDLVGLKMHLINGWCKRYEETSVPLRITLFPRGTRCE